MAISNSASSLRTGVCTSTTRPTAPYNGQVIYETDTKQTLVYNGSSWIMLTDADQPPGLQYITTYTLSSWVNQITSVFTSEFTDYRAIFSYKSTSANQVYLRWLVGSTVQTGNILSQVIGVQYSVGTVGAGSRGDQYALLPAAYTTYQTRFAMDIFSPQATAYTSFNTGSITVGVSNPDSLLEIYAGRNIATTAMDGMEITTATGAAVLSGSVVLYGYRK